MVPGLYSYLDCLLVGDRAHHDAVDRDIPLRILRTDADPTPRSNQPNCGVAHSSVGCAVYVAVMLADSGCSGADITAASTPEAQQEVADEHNGHHDANDDLDDVAARTTQDPRQPECCVIHRRSLLCVVCVAPYRAAGERGRHHLTVAAPEHQ